MIYLVIPKEYSTRFIEYFIKYNLKSKIVEEELLEINSDDYLRFLNIINKDYLTRYISRIFFVEKEVKNIEEIPNNNKKLRVQAYPKKEETKIIEELEKKGFNLSPTDFEEILFIVKINNNKYYQILDKKYFYRKTQEKHIARAYYKIKQIVCEKTIDVNNKVILDIGAAPGGWSEYLKESASMIIAVDPAKLEIASEKIIHFKNKLEDVIKQINNYEYDIIICDINDEFYKIFKNVLLLNYSKKQIIITIKFSRKSKQKINKEIEEIIEYMKKYSTNVDIFWLFANTKFERTLCCVIE
jgi:23S rRNA U2552 (ribose-2'-O)-methylase RlmE/FtsJ